MAVPDERALGHLERAGGHAVPARDRQREALPDGVVREAEARRPRRGVDVEGGDLELGVAEREGLHLREVGREDEPWAALEQVGEHADRERGPFDRVRAGAGLVEEHEPAAPREARDVGQVLGVGREGREIAVD